MRTLRTTNCPAWCLVDHEALGDHEALVQWRVHESAPATVDTHLGDRVLVEVLAGDDLQTDDRGQPTVRVAVDPEVELTPTEALKLASNLLAAVALTDWRVS
jgi:hypothetical protein